MTGTKGRALVTGASSGIGAAFATVLAEKAYDLVLIARRGDRLAALAAELSAQFGVQCEVLLADLADPVGLLAVERRLEQAGNITLLVNNAGIGDIAAFVDQAREVHARMIAINVTAPTMLAHAAARSMLRHGQGAIINVASGLSFQYRAGASVYAASKAFVLHLTRGLEVELAPAGIRCQALVPGLTRTELGGAAGKAFLDMAPPETVMSPVDVARASLAGLALGEIVCLPRIEDNLAADEIQRAYRELGTGPGHNRVASRYLARS